MVHLFCLLVTIDTMSNTFDFKNVRYKRADVLTNFIIDIFSIKQAYTSSTPLHHHHDNVILARGIRVNWDAITSGLENFAETNYIEVKVITMYVT